VERPAVDKIGATNWFWSFPSKESAARRARARQLRDRVGQLEGSIAGLEARKAELLKDRPPSDERTARLVQLHDATKRRAELEERLAVAKANDPEEARRVHEQLKASKAGAERWVDNTWAIADWLKKSHGMSRQDAQKQLGISDEFDYPVYRPGK
jgi:TolA-binding protein